MLNLLELCDFSRDKILRDVMSYIVSRGPATAYKIANDLNYHFSQVYRKVRRLEKYGLIERSNGHRGDLLASTVRGLIVCYYYNCASQELILNKLRKNLNIDKEHLARFLDVYLEYAKGGAPIDELPIMIFYALYKGTPQELLSPLLPSVIRYIKGNIISQ